MGKRILILFFLTGLVSLVQAQETTEYATDTVVVRESVVEDEEAYETNNDEYFSLDTFLFSHAVSIEKDSIGNWKKKKEYAYMKNLDSLLKASQEQKPKVKQQIPQGGDSFATRLLGGPVIKIILWTLALFFIGIIVYQLLKNNAVFKRASTSKVAEKLEDEELLLLHDDFEKLAQQAIAVGDYRMAVRYHFLKVLQQLRDRNHINYEPDKTNGRYVYELPINWRNDFSKLIFQYEYVWYGHFDINKEQYEQVRKGFHSFSQKV